MKKQPKIDLKLTKTDKIIEAIGYLTLVAFWIMNCSSFYRLPDTIPILYNALGEVDGYGSKYSIFALPSIGTFLFVLLTELNKYPETFKYSVEINDENAEKQYTNSTKMIRSLKVIIICIFLLIDYFTIQTALGNSEGIGIWFLPITIALFVIPISYFTYKSYSSNK